MNDYERPHAIDCDMGDDCTCAASIPPPPIANRQVGDPESAGILADVVSRVTYKEGWTFEFREIERGQGCAGLTLMIGAPVIDSFNPGQTTNVLHLMPVMPAAYTAKDWIRWVMEQIILVERHEAMEFYEVDGHKPFFPGHGPGRDPYAMKLVQSAEESVEAATPWYGGTPNDSRFDA